MYGDKDNPWSYPVHEWKNAAERSQAWADIARKNLPPTLGKKLFIIMIYALVVAGFMVAAVWGSTQI